MLPALPSPPPLTCFWNFFDHLYIHLTPEPRLPPQCGSASCAISTALLDGAAAKRLERQTSAHAKRNLNIALTFPPLLTVTLYVSPSEILYFANRAQVQFPVSLSPSFLLYFRKCRGGDRSECSVWTERRESRFRMKSTTVCCRREREEFSISGISPLLHSSFLRFERPPPCCLCHDMPRLSWGGMDTGGKRELPEARTPYLRTEKVG